MLIRDDQGRYAVLSRPSASHRRSERSGICLSGTEPFLPRLSSDDTTVLYRDWTAIVIGRAHDNKVGAFMFRLARSLCASLEFEFGHACIPARSPYL